MSQDVYGRGILGSSFLALAFRPPRCFFGWCWSMSMVFHAHTMQLFYERKEEGLHVLAVQTTIAVAACLDWLCTARRRRSLKEELLKSRTCKKSRVFRRRHLSLIVRVRDTVWRFPRRYLPLLPTSFLHKSMSTRDCGWCFRRILHSWSTPPRKLLSIVVQNN